MSVSFVTVLYFCCVSSERAKHLTANDTLAKSSTMLHAKFIPRVSRTKQCKIHIFLPESFEQLCFKFVRHLLQWAISRSDSTVCFSCVSVPKIVLGNTCESMRWPKCLKCLKWPHKINVHWDHRMRIDSRSHFADLLILFGI